MQISVQFFSQLKECAGASELPIELPDGATVADLLAQLYREHPRLQPWDHNLLIGLGVEFVERTHVLQPNDEIAIMPPVQGG